MIHIRSGKRVACGGELVSGDTLTDVALESSCDDCRGKVMVGPMKQRGCELRAPLVYEPQPIANADEVIAEARRKRDGY